MSRYLNRRQIRAEALLLFALTDEWLTASEVAGELELGHNHGWTACALVLERLAHEGEVELRNPRSRGKRYFRRAA